MSLGVLVLSVTLLIGCASAILGSDGEEYILTPFGYWLKDCVHVVDSGAFIDNEADAILVNGVRRRRCRVPHNSTDIAMQIAHSQQRLARFGGPQATASGWQAYVKQDAGNSVSAFLGDWTVPALPVKATREEVLYTFTALQNIDWVPPEREPSEAFDIIQPVLQYGYQSGAGGGEFWGVSSWYVTLSNDVVQSKLVRVQPGDNIFGNMTKTGADTWVVVSTDTTSGQSTHFTLSRTIFKTQPWVYVTLEVYGISDCQDEYPAKGTAVPYTKLLLQENGVDADLKFQIGTNGQTNPPCTPSIAINSATAVTITF